ncbi:MAG: PD40 domain-containing protein, partial [Bacteroidales bacterium]|nr:PD40 domain-containing protein [Bacteroidales bacterium]
MKNLFTLLLLCMQITAFASEALWMRYPSISPDGNSITFSYKGDIWVVSSNGGRARQLTSNTAYDYSPIWSPDGKEIAFASDRRGNFDIYTVPAEGGNPKRITTHSASETPWSYTPDGKKIVFSAKIQDPASSVLFPKSSMTELYTVSREGGRAEQILATPAEEVSFLGSDKKFVYQDKKGGENIWRKHHTSSITRDIWLYNDGKHTKLTTFEGEDRFPCASPDGSTIYYLSEREGNFNVYSFPLSNPAQITRITNHKTHPVRFLSVSNNGTLCYGYDGGIYVKRANENPVKIKVETIADNTASNMATLSVSGGSGATISPDGKQIAFINRGELFVTSTNYTTTKQITNTAASEADVTFSPDGRKLAYASEREGKWNIFTAELVRKEDINFPNATLIEEKPLFKKNDVDRRSPEFSPDGTEL